MRLVRKHHTWVSLLALLSCCLYAFLGLVRLATYRATTFDLVIFDQTVRAYADFSAPHTAAVGAFRDRGLEYLQLADHFSPIWALLAPFYWVHDSPATLIVAQALLLAAAVPFIWVFTRRQLGRAAAYCVSVAYALSWPIAQMVNFDVHEVMFVPVLSAIAIERYQVRSYLGFYAAIFGLLLVKEDMGLIVVGFGLYLLTRRDWFHACNTIGLGLLHFGLVRAVLIPAAGGDPTDYWAYGHLGEGVSQMVAAVFSDPFSALFGNGAEAKVDTMVLLVWPTLLLCLLSPLTLAALPNLFERLLSDREPWWQADFHYNAFIVVILLCAGVDGLVRLLRWVKRPGDRSLQLLWAGAVAVVALTLVPRFAFDQLVSPDFYKGDEGRAAALEPALEQVPDGVVVEAVNYAGPALTDRTTVLLWRPEPSGAPWIVADTVRWDFPFGSLEDQAGTVTRLESEGYRRVFEKDGVVVLHRP
ncbi:DUF2079 domain-containing protein [Nonomuraea soli]|uniref:Putative membrane protein n=1 Tax=Nonomuraea soli TaxID=1032476 RepID=A0A7W0CLV5_9ACTN|nr:DUF2079 domain-containing protein [Nonomuraea soli]MBA2893593.1 putative membrane protein [Nonomuraea soli]